MATRQSFSVDTWSTDFLAPADIAASGLTASAADVDLSPERSPDAWAPIRPAVPPARIVLFIDGVQRIDARVHIDVDGIGHQGACASWAAGVIRCEDRAVLVAAEVRRGLLCTGAAIEPIVTRHGSYAPVPVPDTGPGTDALGQALGRVRGDLEGQVAVKAGSAAGGHELMVVDGPLGDRRHIDSAVGYIKAHHVDYLGEQQAVIGQLEAGERTPLFTIGDRRFRWSWYVQLPGPKPHPRWGIARCEAAGDLTRADAIERADLVTATLQRFASKTYQDPRAPQNLHPIAGLERELKRRLGDPIIIERALRSAAQ